MKDIINSKKYKWTHPFKKNRMKKQQQKPGLKKFSNKEKIIFKKLDNNNFNFWDSLNKNHKKLINRYWMHYRRKQKVKICSICKTNKIRYGTFGYRVYHNHSKPTIQNKEGHIYVCKNCEIRLTTKSIKKYINYCVCGCGG